MAASEPGPAGGSGPPPASAPSVLDQARAAVQADVMGNLEEAVALYTAVADALDAQEDGDEELKAKAANYRARVQVLQQRLQQLKMQQYARAAKIAQEASQLAVRGEEAVKVAGGSSTMAGAAAVGAGAGLLVAGPLGLVAAGAAAAYAATTSTTVGEAARNTGEVAVQGVENIKEFDRQHEISQKAYRAYEAGTKRIAKLDKNMKVSERLQDFWGNATKNFSSMESNYRIGDRLGEGMGAGFDWLTQRLAVPEDGLEPDPEEGEAPTESPTLPDVPT